MTTLVAAVFVLGVLVFIHELGHFLVAKLFKIRVERFSLGYPPRMVGKKIGDTDYCISWIPFGGYVKIAGMIDESLDKDALDGPPQPWEYRSKPWWQRFSVIAAGPLVNLIFSLLVFVGLVLATGVPEEIQDPVVGAILESSPAQEAGLLQGDRILSIDGQPVSRWEDMTSIVHASPHVEMRFEISRNDSVFTLPITPLMEKEFGEPYTGEHGLIGINVLAKYRHATLGEAFQNGGSLFVDVTRLIFDSFYKLVSGQVSLKEVSGPVGIARMAGESARAGFGSLIFFMGLLSINLGILNLLPIPVLDGGHLLFMGVELIIRRELPIKVKMIIQQVFMVLLMILMVLVVYNDVAKIVTK